MSATVWHVRVSDDTMTERTLVYTIERKAWEACLKATENGFKVRVQEAVRIKERV